MLSQAAIRRSRLGVIAILLAVAGLVSVSWPHASGLFSRLFRKPVDFSSDIRPIFNQNSYDQKTRNGLRWHNLRFARFSSNRFR